MATMDELLANINTLAGQGDAEGVRAARKEFLKDYAATTEAAEIFYKSGLDVLFTNHDLATAMDAFKAAVALKAPIWSAAARVSLAICIYRQGDVQKALFELRKVAYPEDADSNSITALAYIEFICEEQNNQDDLLRARKDRITQLKALAKEADPDFEPELKAFYLKELGWEYIRNKETDLAAKRLNEALELGEENIGSQLFAEINDLMP